MNTRILNPYVRQSRLFGPLVVLIVAVLGLNLGMYTRLVPERTGVYSLPFWDVFERTELGWPSSAAGWRLEGGWLKSERAGSSLWIPVVVPATVKYQFKTVIRLSPGSSAALLFNAQRDHLAARVQRVLLKRNGSSLSIGCGDLDQQGLFRLQAETTVNVGAESLKLEIVVGTSAFSVWLDDRAVLRDVPLHYRGGQAGLESRGAAFDELLVREWDGTDRADHDPVPSAQREKMPSAQGTPGTDPDARGWNTLAGTWVLDRGGLRQDSDHEYDRDVLFAQEPFSNATISMSFKHVRGAGAGLLFNAPEASSHNGAQLVRYSEDGRTVFWGHYDAQGVFVGEGNAGVGAPGTGSHVLEVKNQSGRYTVRLDGHDLVRDAPSVNPSGFVGLSTSQSAVLFSRLEVSVPGAGDASGKPTSKRLLGETVNRP